MGGPGLTALTCVQHISRAADIVRSLNQPEHRSPEEVKATLVNVLEQLAEAKLAGIEAREEIDQISAYAEMRGAELQSFGEHLRFGTHPASAPTAPVQELQVLTPEGDAERAANLVRLVSFAAADQGFRSLDTFATWFVGGTAAAVGLMIANFEKIRPVIGSLDLQWTLVMVIIALAHHWRCEILWKSRMHDGTRRGALA